MPEYQIKKRVRIEVPPEVETEAKRRAREGGGIVENYLLDQVDLEIEWVCMD